MTTGIGEGRRAPGGATDDYMHIGQVSDVTGLTRRTIRYYEELGLLPAPERTHGDFRVYTPQDVSRLSEIARLKELLGISLSEVKEIVVANEAREQLTAHAKEASDAGARIGLLRELEGLVTSQLAILDRKMAQMAEMKSELEARAASYRDRIGEIAPVEQSRGQS
jgi:DNA-binding transcriptional MerR regulator